MKNIYQTVVALIFLALSSAANASVVSVVQSADTWEYNFGASLGILGGDTSYSTFSSGYTGGQTAAGPFGNQVIGTSVVPYTTTWAANTAVYMQKTVDLTGYSVSSAYLNLAVDNGASVFVNGTKVFGADECCYTWMWEYANQIVPASAFINGINTISVVANDWGGATYFDMEMIAEGTSTISASTPYTGMILALVLTGIFIKRKNAIHREELSK